MSLRLTFNVAISLIFVWLLSALRAGAVNEVIAGWLNLRGNISDQGDWDSYPPTSANKRVMSPTIADFSI